MITRTSQTPPLCLAGETSGGQLLGVHLQAPLLHTPAQGRGWGFTRGPGQPRHQRPSGHSSQHTTVEGQQRREGLPRAPVVPAALLPEPKCDAGHTSPLPTGRACQSPAVSAVHTGSVRGFCAHGRRRRCAHVCDAAIRSHFHHLGIFLPSIATPPTAKTQSNPQAPHQQKTNSQTVRSHGHDVSFNSTRERYSA